MNRIIGVIALIGFILMLPILATIIDLYTRFFFSKHLLTWGDTPDERFGRFLLAGIFCMASGFCFNLCADLDKKIKK